MELKYYRPQTTAMFDKEKSDYWRHHLKPYVGQNLKYILETLKYKLALLSSLLSTFTWLVLQQIKDEGC